VKTPFSVPIEIAGLNKTVKSEGGVLNDWVTIVVDPNDSSFKI